MGSFAVLKVGASDGSDILLLNASVIVLNNRGILHWSAPLQVSCFRDGVCVFVDAAVRQKLAPYNARLERTMRVQQIRVVVYRSSARIVFSAFGWILQSTENRTNMCFSPVCINVSILVLSGECGMLLPYGGKGSCKFDPLAVWKLIIYKYAVSCTMLVLTCTLDDI